MKWLYILCFLTLALTAKVWAQSNEDCLACHGDSSLTTEREGKEVSLFLEEKTFRTSVHGEFDCVTCHSGFDAEALPHKEKIEPVDCGMCHEATAKVYEGSLHGQAVKKGAKLAPRCWDCHGTHDIVTVKSANSKVAKFNIPFVCGKCHKEGTEVTRTYDIPQEEILTHYSESIHGEGLFKQGLTVTAVCTDCHTSHNVLPHTDQRSSIFRDNVPKTCEKCHGLIEEVHRKVIRGELWEKEPNKVPICVDCHSPHQIRKVYYDQGASDRDCLTCHSDPNLSIIRRGANISLYINSDILHSSVHRKVACAQCHTGVNVAARRPCETVVTKVDCSICHAEAVNLYASSTHGKLAERGDPNAPDCHDCHGTHETKGRRDPNSPTYPIKVPDLCSQCHREGSKAAVRYTGKERHITENYVESIHGQGLLGSGLIVTATCTDCHTAHHVLPHDDPASSINRGRIAKTCAKCHQGIYEKFKQSVHSETVTKTDKPLPVCYDCHSAHTITRADEKGFKLSIINQCGKCHEEVTASYFETYHGKVSKLGYAATAKCYDCHGAHDVLPNYNPQSHLSRQNIVKTCAKCHPGSHRRFAGYLTHATHHERHRYPILFYSFWFMTSLLIGTLIFFGLHTMLWLPRSFQTMKKRKALKSESPGLEFQRFRPLERQLHGLVVISFLGLALTGMTLKFSYLPWAQWLSHMLGGFESAGFIHRICALITFFYFGIHIFDLVKRKRQQKTTWKKFFIGSNSMLPNKNDWQEFVDTYKWFIGLGPRPQYGRWTYWEKFDYFAVFWGVSMIGFSGFILWFPEFFTHLFPGWFINVATIIHSDEALLAVGFIFTVHFFNTHLRPDKFPMDTVIFTGRVSLEEFKHDRPREYEELIKSGKFENYLVPPLPPAMVRAAKVIGWIELSIGLILILLIIVAEVFQYR